LATLAFLAAQTLGGPTAAAENPALDARFVELDQARGPRSARLVDELAREGGAAAARALVAPGGEFAALPLLARRARAEILARTIQPEQIAPAVDALSDPDAQVVRRLVDALAAPALRSEQLELRIEALRQAALESTDLDTAAHAARGLGRIAVAEASAALVRVVELSDGEVQLAAARALVGAPRDSERLLELLRRAFDGGAPRISGAPLALLVSDGLGEALARSPLGGESSRDRALFVLGAQHPDPRVVAATRRALVTFVDRCAQLGDAPRAESTLAGLSACGLDDFELLTRRIRLALQFDADAARARSLADEIVASHPLSGDSYVRLRRAAGCLLAGVSSVAAADPTAARAPLREADILLAALQREGAFARMTEPGRDEVDVYVMRTLVAVHRVVAELAAGGRDDEARVLEAARAADLRVVELQRALARHVDFDSGERRASYDDVLFHELGPAALYFSTRDASGYSRERWLDIETRLYQALANVSRGLFPGFEAHATFDPQLADPMADDERRAALERLQNARHASMREAVARRIRELERDVQERDGDPNDWYQAQMIERILKQRQQEELDQRETGLLRQREFSRAALILVDRLRENGRSAAARGLAERAVKDLDAVRGQLDDGSFELVLVRAESALGGVLMDQDEPVAAEAALNKALERLKSLETQIEARNGPGSASDALRSAKSGVLVSLAVNANVKLKDAKRAVEFFERAYELDQSDFMRILLACYRARVGRDDEARALLRDTPIGPGNYYNAACTHALLGDVELALDYLRRDFDEMRTSAGARERQKDWARGDPDLASLTEDPRFRALVSAAENVRDDGGDAEDSSQKKQR